MPPWEGTLSGVSGQLKSIEKHRILGVGYKNELIKNGLSHLHIVWRVFTQGVVKSY